MKTPLAWILSLCAGVLLAAPAVRAADQPAPLRVVLIGDSTMCEYPSTDPRFGWGHFLQDYFNDSVRVINLAKSGRSTRTFIGEGLWAAALKQKPDFVLIQFGHNDSHGAGHPEATDAASTYRDFLRRYIDETRAAGATPILVTPMCRRDFGADGQLQNGLRPYADAMKAVAAEKQVGLVDLNASSVLLAQALGPTRSLALANRPGDATHFNEQGARAMAELVMRDLPAQAPALAARLAPPGDAPSALTVLGFADLAGAAAPASHLVFFGTYTLKDSRGIYSARLDGATGTLSAPVLAAATPNPSFLALHPNHRFLYAHCDLGTTADGKVGGAIRAFALDPATGQLTLLNTVATGDPFCSNVAVDPTGQVLMTVSGTGGHIFSYPIRPDGSLGPLASRLRNDGPPGPVVTRQQKTYPHSSTFSPDDRFVMVCDLGLDRVFAYRTDLATAVLQPLERPYAQFKPGTGPRHSKFSADGRFFYAVGELANTITACAYDAATGRVSPFQTLSTIPAGFKGETTTSEVRIHPNGQFVYAASRGADCLAVYARNVATGVLTPVEIVPSGGHFPRNFALSPDGRWLVCGHQESGNTTVFAVDPATGRLTRAPSTQPVPEAICVLFVN
jgi:6-phosphogluconolactonase